MSVMTAPIGITQNASTAPYPTETRHRVPGGPVPSC
jgi:hypothetical protein